MAAGEPGESGRGGLCGVPRREVLELIVPGTEAGLETLRA